MLTNPTRDEGHLLGIGVGHQGRLTEKRVHFADHDVMHFIVWGLYGEFSTTECNWLTPGEAEALRTLLQRRATERVTTPATPAAPERAATPSQSGPTPSPVRPAATNLFAPRPAS